MTKKVIHNKLLDFLKFMAQYILSVTVGQWMMIIALCAMYLDYHKSHNQTTTTLTEQSTQHSQKSDIIIQKEDIIIQLLLKSK